MNNSPGAEGTDDWSDIGADGDELPGPGNNPGQGAPGHLRQEGAPTNPEEGNAESFPDSFREKIQDLIQDLVEEDLVAAQPPVPALVPVVPVPVAVAAAAAAAAAAPAASPSPSPVEESKCESLASELTGFSFSSNRSVPSSEVFAATQRNRDIANEVTGLLRQVRRRLDVNRWPDFPVQKRNQQDFRHHIMVKVFHLMGMRIRLQIPLITFLVNVPPWLTKLSNALPTCIMIPGKTS